MNATLQCFSNCPRSKSKLLDKLLKNELENSTQKLSFALAEVFKNLWKVLSHTQYAPKNFKEIISEMNPLFKGIAANDPKDLVLFLLETMHKELNKVTILKIDQNPNQNSHDFMSVYENFVYNYTSKNESLILDEFYFYSNNVTTCSNCNDTINNVQINSILFFPLEEVRKFMGYNVNYVRITDCFEYYEKQEILPSFYCNKCKTSYQSYIFF